MASGVPAPRPAWRRRLWRGNAQHLVADRCVRNFDPYNEHPILQNYCLEILPSLSARTLENFSTVSYSNWVRILAVMKGFTEDERFCFWSNDEFMDMLLFNQLRRFPKVWEHTQVATSLPPELLDQPPEPDSCWGGSPRWSTPVLSVVIVAASTNLKMRLESWDLWRADFREESVKAWRTHPRRKCPCCGRPALWKCFDGRHGCGPYIMRVICSRYFHTWRALKRRLSSSKNSCFERLLSYAWFSTNVFEAYFLDAERLSCSCGDCSLKFLRSGALCPMDQVYADTESLGPISPRHPFADLVRDAYNPGPERPPRPLELQMLWEP